MPPRNNWLPHTSPVRVSDCIDTVSLLVSCHWHMPKHNGAFALEKWLLQIRNTSWFWYSLACKIRNFSKHPLQLTKNIYLCPAKPRDWPGQRKRILRFVPQRWIWTIHIVKWGVLQGWLLSLFNVCVFEHQHKQWSNPYWNWFSFHGSPDPASENKDKFGRLRSVYHYSVLNQQKRNKMENKEKNETQNRREFFKQAAKKALPILGAITLGSLPQIIKANNEALGCTSGSCYMVCGYSCQKGCSDDCLTSCKGNCKRTCSGGSSGEYSGSTSSSSSS